MDSFFKPRFNAGKCKTLLKLSIPRIKLLRNRREIQIKQMRKEIAKLLETGQEATARIRVEHIIREEKMMAAQEIVELFCELIAVRLPIIEAQKECPLDLKEAISSVCFAAPRCADLPELPQVQILFSGKYGKEFVAAATELMPECGVNRQLVELLSIRAPAPDVKLKLLMEIAEEHGLDWDPSVTEHELLKKHEDLLSGPTQFTSGSKLPFPKEKHEETIQTSTSEPAANEISDDEDFDIVDFPEVPNIPLKTSKGNISTPEMLPFPVSALSEDDNEESNPTAADNIQNPVKPDPVVLEKLIASTKVTDNQSEGGLFVPLATQSQSSPFPKEKQDNSGPVASTTSIDLQDVLAAAQAAAETAERAAAAARSAASIAQLRISELVNRKNDAFPTPENTVFKDDKDGKTPLAESHTASSPIPNNGFIDGGAHQSSQYDPQAAEYYSSSPIGNAVVSPSTDLHHHQPQRLPSLDDESFFSYPNLFTSQSADLSNRT